MTTDKKIEEMAREPMTPKTINRKRKSISLTPIRIWAIRPVALGGQWLLCDDLSLPDQLAEMGERDEVWEVKRWKDLTSEELKNVPEFEGW